MMATKERNGIVVVAVLSVAATVLWQLGVVTLLDFGYVRVRWIFYVLVSISSWLIGSVFNRSAMTIGTALVSSLLATAVFYKTSIQTGVASELANDYDWVLVMVFGSAAVVVSALTAKSRSMRVH